MRKARLLWASRSFLEWVGAGPAARPGHGRPLTCPRGVPDAAGDAREGRGRWRWVRGTWRPSRWRARPTCGPGCAARAPVRTPHRPPDDSGRALAEEKRGAWGWVEAGLRACECAGGVGTRSLRAYEECVAARSRSTAAAGNGSGREDLRWLEVGGGGG